MAKKLDSIVELAAQKTREISANSGNYMAFLTTAAHNFKYNFRDQLLIYAQKPDATACAQIDFWNKHGRYVNQGTRGIALLVDTDQGYKLRYVFDMSDTNSRQGRTIPIWKMEPRYEDAVIEALFAAGIGSSVHYIPLHQQPYWRERYDLRAEDFPHSQKAYLATFSLPLYSRMTLADAERVAAVLRGVLAR